MGKIALLFPGQGSQYVGMGKTMCEKFAVAEKTFKEANEVLGFDLQTLCFKGSFDKLSSPENLQPAILTASVAFYRVFKEEIGLEPEIFLGHSFGELSALVCAGALSFADALKIAQKKGEYVKKEVAGINTAMSAIKGLKKEKIKKVCAEISTKEKIVEVGIINSAKQIIISGQAEAVTAAEKLFKKQGAEIERLRTQAPFHSSLLKKSAQKAKKDLEKIKYKKTQKSVLSSLTIKEYKNSEEIINNLSKSLVAPVDWEAAVRKIEKKEITLTIEIGPQKILTNLVSEITSDIEAFTFNKFIDLDLLKKRFRLDKKSKRDLIIRCVKIAVCTKNNNWDNAEHESGVVKPYQKTRNRLLEIEKDDLDPELEDVIRAVKMLEANFKTKKTEKQEIKERWAEVFPDDYEFAREILKTKGNLKFL